VGWFEAGNLMELWQPLSHGADLGVFLGMNQHRDKFLRSREREKVAKPDEGRWEKIKPTPPGPGFGSHPPSV